ncbi:MAG: hypothetical protein JRJ26_16785 [Deltaproteobacteria bacterium]|nr:hypothetical protein [Deltaproteobacteria bacterium]
MITVTAQDAVGSTATDVITVNYDPSDGEAPTVTITIPTSSSSYSTTSGTITLGGTASDNVGVVEVRWSNGAGGSGVCSGTTSWSTGAIGLVSGTTVFTIIASDSAGNTGRDTLSVTYTPSSGGGGGGSPPPEPDPGGHGDTEIYTGYAGASGVEPNVLIVLDTSSSMRMVRPTETDPTGYDPDTTYPEFDNDEDPWRKDEIYGPDPEGDYYKRFSDISLDEFPCPEMVATVKNSGFWHGHIVLKHEWTKTDWKSLEASDIDYCIPSDWPSGTPYPPYTYPLSVWMGNYLNYMWSDQGSTMVRKIDIAKQVLTELVEATFGVRFGILSYNENKEGGSIQFPVQDMTSGPTGTRQQLIDIINDLETHSGTPLAESQFEAHRYFMPKSWANGGPFFDVGPYKNADTPIQNWCQRNYVVHVTDGSATEDTDSILKTEIGDVEGDDKEDWDDWEVDDVIDDIAQYMYTHDYSDLEGMQNVITYTVGFNIDYQALKDAAQQGGGKYYYCEDTRDLANAFHSIIGEIIQRDTSYTAPVIPVNYVEKTSSKNEIFLALFRPTMQNFWPGNIKKFGIAAEDDPSHGVSRGDLVDLFGNPVLDPSQQILDTAVSFWGPWASGTDGNNVTKGGVGEILRNMDLATRKVYTYMGQSLVLSDASNSFDTSNSANLSPQRLGLQADETFKRDQVINYVRGYDVYDDDQDNATTDTREWILGAFIHSRPLVVSYDENTTVIFAGSNDGMLHAFWDGDQAVHMGGSELWGYIPPVLLPRLRHLSEDTEVPAFYVDGSPAIYINDINNDGRIVKADGDQAILICGLRRGGRYYFALDVTDPENPEIPIGWAGWGLWESDTLWPSTGMIGPDMTTECANKAAATYPYSEMGQTWSKPIIETIDDGGTEKAVAFISAGYDINQDTVTPGLDPAPADTMGRGVYVVDILTGAYVKRWTRAEDANMTHSIASTVTAVDTTGSGLVDRLYVGDTGGKLWRFDLRGLNPSSWTSKVIFNSDTSGTDHRKFFYPPDVTQEDGYEMLFIGSGNRAHPLGKTNVDYLFAIKDRNPTVPLEWGDLEDVTDGLLMTGTEAEKQAILTNLANKDGWYIMLENTGEKCLAPALVFGGGCLLHDL